MFTNTISYLLSIIQLTVKIICKKKKENANKSD